MLDWLAGQSSRGEGGSGFNGLMPAKVQVGARKESDPSDKAFKTSCRPNHI